MAEFVEVMKQQDRMCNYYDEHGECKTCGLSPFNNGTDESCENFCNRHPKEAEKIIMDWAKKNPMMTKAGKVREVLGLSEDEFNLSECCGIKCPYPPSIADACRSCPKKDFWNQEWKDPKEKTDE